MKLGGAKVLVIEDDPAIRALITAALSQADFVVHCAADGTTALAMAQRLAPAAICLDLGLPDYEGMALFEQLGRQAPGVPIIVVTGDGEVTSAVQAMRAGAYDYLVKPVEHRRLVASVTMAAQRNQPSVPTHSRLLGESPAMALLSQHIHRVANSAISVLLHGESGTGKELIAKAIHEQSGRRGAFVALNCAAIPATLQNSELFGHEKGAFTGAANRAIGRFEQAHEGTLFLDEVAELPLDVQATLLRALQERAFHRVGGTTLVRSDFRLIAASHKDLVEEVAAGRFREDLFFRIAVVELDVPPLREREGDIELLAHHFCRHFAAELGREIRLSHAALLALLAHDWPGNVRELQNAIYRAMVLAQGDQIMPTDLPPRLLRSDGGLRRSSTRIAVVTPGEASTPEAIPDERTAILHAMAKHAKNMTHVAKDLGIGRTTLYRRLKKYGIVAE